MKFVQKIENQYFDPSFIILNLSLPDFGVKSCWIILPEVRTIYVFSTPKFYKAFLGRDLLRDESVGVKVPL